MITPPFLSTGDTIGIISPGAQIANEKIDNAIRILKKQGFTVKSGKYVLSRSNYFAGTDEQRTADFQNMLDDPEIKAMLCSRGGYGMVRIISKLDFTNFIKFPKWIIGFSDITVLHSYLNNFLKTASLHASMPIDFPDNPANDISFNSLINAITGGNMNCRFPYISLNKPGKTEGTLIGGNLSVLYSLRGTNFDFNPEGKILFLEDIGEYLYHLDRMLMNLKLGGVFEKLKGLINGEMNDMKDTTNSFANSAYDVINEIVKEYNFPVAYSFPAGHSKNNQAIILGKQITLDVNKNYSEIGY